MRRISIIFGTLLITTILLAGGVFAQNVDLYSSSYCVTPENIEGQDSDEAHLGQASFPTYHLGAIVCEWDGAGLTANQNFTIVADSTVQEEYNVYCGHTPDVADMVYVGSGDDLDTCSFNAPNEDADWQYVWIVATSGTTGMGDPYYGPDLMWLYAA